MSDQTLYARGTATLLASWEAYASGSTGGSVRRLNGVAVAVFPRGPERAVYNNALFERDLCISACEFAVDEMETAYRSAGVENFAAWVHECDHVLQAEFAARGYSIQETTRAMGRPIPRDVTPPGANLVYPDWPTYLACLEAAGAPDGILSGADPGAFSPLAAQVRDGPLATALSFDLGGDCGIFNMFTPASARRRGLASALTAGHIHEAAGRGCLTASLQATPMAESVYVAAGFRDLGKILEYGL